jgi:hypothetical protein
MKRHRQYILFAVVCVILFAIADHFAPPTPFFGGDTPGYIDFISQRTAGYPILIKAITWADGGLGILPVVQLSMMCGAAALFSMGIYCLTRSIWSSILTIVLVLGNYEVVKYSYWVLSDGPFISLLLAMLGCCAFWLGTKKAAWLAGASFFLGAAVTVRPDGITLLPMLAIVYATVPREYRGGALTFVLLSAPAATAVTLSAVAYHHYHKSWNPDSVLGINLLGKAARLADGSEPSKHPEWIATIGNIASPYRRRFAVGESFIDRALLSAPVYDNIRHSLGLLPGDANLAVNREELGTGANADRALTSLAFDIIRAHKLAYLHIIAENYGGLWYIPQLLSGDDVRRLQSIIAQRAPATDYKAEVDYIPVPRPLFIVGFMHLFQIGVFLISVAFLIIPPLELIEGGQPSLIAWFGCSAAICLHVSFLVIAFINETKPRLTLDYWPLEALVVVLAFTLGAKTIVGNVWRFRTSLRSRAAPESRRS